MTLGYALPASGGELTVDTADVPEKSDALLGFPADVDVAVNPDFTFARNDYYVCLAHAQSPIHARVNELVSSMYGAKGLGTATSAQAATCPEQVTLAACGRGDRVFGTLTLGMDSDAGLLADSLYRPQVDELRAQGRRLCEVTRLVINTEARSAEVMATLFNVAFVLAKGRHDRTDLVAEVHPRHAGFYQRTMGYRVAGPVRTCERVDAPAVLMHLCLNFAEKQIRQLAGKLAGGDRSLYRLFLPHPEQETLVRQLLMPAAAVA